MFSLKNISPRQLSAITALLLAVPVGLLVGLLEKSWAWGGITFIVVLGGSYFLVSFMIERFIYRKIKLIYKFIYKTKATKREETYYKYVLPQKGIDEVSQDVEEWAIKNEEELQLLRRNEQFRKEFLQNLSHEFKTPVFAIQGYVDTLLAGALANPDVNKQNFVIQDLVRDVYESLSLKAEKMNIQCSIKKGCELSLTVFADKEKIRQVLINTVGNSIKYGKNGGSIVASMYNTDGKHILIELSDDGIGINAKHLPRIFERFYRTEEGRSIDVSGSGLGLAICKHIIEAHGQTIHVRSTEDVGTTIGFTLESKRD
jgi:two-component system, OmpR family, phosphate regulon sensor histidine kinase PhoR